MRKLAWAVQLFAHFNPILVGACTEQRVVFLNYRWKRWCQDLVICDRMDSKLQGALYSEVHGARSSRRTNVRKECKMLRELALKWKSTFPNIFENGPPGALSHDVLVCTTYYVWQTCLPIDPLRWPWYQGSCQSQALPFSPVFFPVSNFSTIDWTGSNYVMWVTSAWHRAVSYMYIELNMCSSVYTNTDRQWEAVLTEETNSVSCLSVVLHF